MNLMQTSLSIHENSSRRILLITLVPYSPNNKII